MGAFGASQKEYLLNRIITYANLLKFCDAICSSSVRIIVCCTKSIKNQHGCSCTRVELYVLCDDRLGSSFGGIRNNIAVAILKRSYTDSFFEDL